MAGKIQIQVQMPEQRERWRPAMVAKVTGQPMVEVLLYRNRYRVRRPFHSDLRASLFVAGCEHEGVEETIKGWDRLWEEFTRYRREFMQRSGIW